MQTTSGLQVPEGASLTLRSTGCAQADVVDTTKPVRQLRRENTRNKRGRMSAHNVFVLGKEGTPLTPTTPAKARKLLRGGVAEKVWSKFGTFGIKMSNETRNETPVTTMGIDTGTKFEGYAVVCGTENQMSVKLDLPDKKVIVRKMEDRHILRRARRFRKCRRRPCRSNNRARAGFLAPSQKVVVGSRLKVMGALFKMYPVSRTGLEDVRFDYAHHRWGSNFSTVEIGKTALREFIRGHGSVLTEFRGHETEGLRKKYGYRKTKDKSEDNFTAHCSDALALACEVATQNRVEPGRFVCVDDTYRYYRRRLHDTQPGKGGIRQGFAHGTVFGLRKGVLIGAARGRKGRLCGERNGIYRYCIYKGKRTTATRIAWMSSQFILK